MNFTFHLLPNNDAKTHDKTIPHHNKAFYNGSSKALGWFFQNIIYIGSFFIPALFLLILLALNGFMPFGEKDLFILNNTQQAVPSLLDFISQIQNGNFSLFLSHGSLSGEALNSFISYLSGPSRLILLLFPAKTALMLLHISIPVQIGLAGFFMAYYLTHREKGKRYSKYDFAPLVFSFCYSLSSYMLVQYNDIMYLDCAVFFPLLFLAYEKLIYHGKKKGFFILFTYMLLCNFYLTTVLSLFLFVYCILQPKRNLKKMCSRLFLYLITTVLSFLTGAIVVIPGFSMFFSASSELLCPDFTFLIDWISFYSLFLSAGYGSYVWTDIYGSNVYCGILCILLFVFYLLNRNIPLKDKYRDVLFLFLLVFVSNTSSFQFFAHLGGSDPSFFNMFGFLIPFFLIAICCDTLYDLKDNSLAKNLIGVLIPFALYLYASLESAVYTNSASMMFALLLFISYLLVFLFYSIHSIDGKAFFSCLCLILMLELGYNGIQNMEFIELDALSYTEKTENLTEGVASNIYTPLNIPDSTFSLPLCYHIEGTYTYGTPYSTTEFKRLNEIAYSLGATSDLFTDAKLDITWKASDNIICRQTSSNIFSLSVKEGTPNSEVPYNRLFTTITPDQSGDLYIYSNELTHLGKVTAGKGIPYTMSFETTTNLFRNYWIYGVYYHPEVLEELEEALACEYSPLEKAGLFGYKTTIHPKTDGTFVINTPYSEYIKIYVDGILSEAHKGPAEQTAVYVPKGTHNLRIVYQYTPLYVGLFLSLFMLCIALPAFLCFRKRKNVAVCITQLKNKIYHAPVWEQAEYFLCRHAVLILSFVIPFSVLLLSCIFSSYTPFGLDSFYKNDGSALTLPQMYQMRNQLSNQSLLYTWTTGGGSNLFYTIPNMFLYIWLLLIPVEHMIPVLTIIEIILMALSAPAMYWYLTHRSVGQRMHRMDYRLLFFTTAYSLSAYNINFRGFYTWPVVLVLFPLLLLTLDALIEKKKTTGYIFCLALIMMINFNLTLFICVFLVFTFFTYHFKGIKDFFRKGFRFAGASIVAAGLNFFALYATVLSLKISPYQSTDSVAPTFTFYQSYWESLKQFFLFAEPVIVTEENGAINLYCGLFCLVLLIISLFINKAHRNKWLKLALLVFILFSSNNEVLSYIWNGFHYQSKVPNRYSFLAVFLILDMGCEALYHLRKLTRKKFVLVLSTIIALVGCSIFFAKDRISTLSAVGTPIVLIIFFVLLLLLLIKPNRKALIMRWMLAISILEISANTCHNLITVPEEISITYSTQAIDYLKDNMTGPYSSKRIALLGPNTSNQNMIHNVNIMAQFNSFFTKYQQKRGLLYGYLSSNNFLKADYNLTPFTNTMDAVEYMALNHFTMTQYTDLEHYEPVAQYKNNVILHNKYALSLAHFAPYEAYVFTQNAQHIGDYANAYASAYIGDNEMFRHAQFLYNIENDENADPENYYKLTIDDSLGDYKYRQTLHFTPKESGEYYYRIHECHYLGYLEAGKTYEFDIMTSSDLYGLLVMFDKDTYEEFAKEINKYTLNVTSQTDTTLDGTITLPKDGCIVFSIPYEEGWTVWIDGQKTNTADMTDGSLFITATEGTHEIHMEFRPVGLDTCINVSLVFAVIFLLILFAENRRKKTPAQVPAKENIDL